MKKNFPVTNQEKTFSAGDNILSTTDLKGAVTYVNDDFCRIAEFEPEELLNKNHNVIRHPEMPPSAFQNLWDTLKEGKPWMGIVKNRCKGGDHYWVDAYVTPIKSGGEVLEFQSVRFIPPPASVERAEQAYKELIKDKIPSAVKRVSLSLRTKLVLAAAASFLPLCWLSVANVGILSTLYALVPSVFLLYMSSSLLLTRLNKLSEKAKAIYDNKLMAHIYTGATDDLASIELSFKMVSSELRAVLGRFKDSSDNIQSTAEASSELMENASSSMVSQQGEIHQLASAVEEMTTSFSEVARNCETASQQTNKAMRLANNGQQVAAKAVQANQLLVKEIDTTTESIEQLASYSQDIGGVLDVIRGVADQTNLLALNAAIEAARAGEQGRGFAVVADEVRNLARRTQEATQEIESMIEKLQAGSNQAAEGMRQSRTLFESGVEDIMRTGESIESIAESVQSISDMATEIASATEQQSHVAQDISRNIVNIGDQATETAGKAREAQLLSQEFSGLAVAQQRLVTQLLK